MLFAPCIVFDLSRFASVGVIGYGRFELAFEGFGEVFLVSRRGPAATGFLVTILVVCAASLRRMCMRLLLSAAGTSKLEAYACSKVYVPSIRHLVGVKG